MENKPMTVNSILKTKAADRKGPAVVTSSAQSTLTDIAKILAANNVGAVVIVSADERVDGIISERDIVRHIAKSGADVLTRTAGDVMTRTVITCKAEDSIDSVMSKMTKGRFRHVPVVEANGRLTGVVSIGDVVKSHVEEVEHEASALRDYISHH
jgi:CBS domain-containing protein